MGLLSGLAGGFKSGLGALGGALGLKAPPGAALMGMGGGGGLLGGLGGLIHGTGAELSVQDRPDLEGGVDPTTGQNIGPIKQMPNITETKPAQAGILDRMKAPDGRGLTFGDKLFAAGSVLQGDSGGAATYIQNQRNAADQLAERTRSRDLAAQGLDALRGAIDPATGQLDYRKYLAALPAGADPSAGIGIGKAMRPNLQFLQSTGGGVSVGNQDTGEVTEKVKGAPKPPGPLMQDEDGNWVINPQYVDLQEQVAAAKRRGAPPVGRSGRSGGRPKSYGASEIQWGQ